ncbi:organic cation transporter protein-like isoform X1 [Ctenocephalides felis]|uniref:organic cation transporter protein-like isoform X1 n=1 Tax=Ctenocephalides felis TaxID=7515 RepID=UPI000E6E4380|nr:organic cation transporter protein-like isoform X1 [Ctenocephalides felis]
MSTNMEGEEEKQQDLDLDSVLRELGQFGKFQLINYLFICLPILFSAIFTLSYVFTAGQVEYRCLVPECEQVTFQNRSSFLIADEGKFEPSWIQNVLPFDAGGKVSQCTRYKLSGYNFKTETEPIPSPINHLQDLQNKPIQNDELPNIEDKKKSFLKDNTNQCSSLHHPTNETESCDILVYKNGEKTIVNEFNLTCEDQEWKRTLIGTVNNIGQFVCLPLSGFISDRYGRRTVLVFGIVISGVMGIIRSFSTSYIMFLIFEFLDPALGSGVYSAGFILGMELVGPKKRVLGGAIISCCYALGEAVLGLAAMWLPDWRILLRVLYTPALLFVVYPLLIPESVRWLMHKKRHNEALKIIMRCAKTNDVVLSELALGVLTPKEEEALRKNSLKQNDECTYLNPDQKYNRGYQTEKRLISNGVDTANNHQQFSSAGSQKITKKANYPILTVLKSKFLLLRVANCSFCWLTNTFVYYGLSLNSVAVDGNKYYNFVLVSLIEIPGYIFTYLISNKFGRRSSLCASLLISGLSCVVSNYVDAETAWLRLTLYLLGKFSITVAFTVLYVYTAELFPTSLRHSLLATCSMFGRIGSMVAPQTPLLARFMPSLPMLMFGGCAIISGLLILQFPETLDTRLPDTVQEAEDIGKKKSDVVV